MLQPTVRPPCAGQLTWTRGTLLKLGEKLKNAPSALEAAFNFDRHLSKLAKNRDYGFSKYDSDWFDFNHLIYLADDQIYVVANNTTILRETSKNVQTH